MILVKQVVVYIQAVAVMTNAQLDLHMYVRKAVVEMGELIVDMQKALIETAEKYSDVIMPGYTHLQRAQTCIVWSSYDGILLYARTRL